MSKLVKTPKDCMDHKRVEYTVRANRDKGGRLLPAAGDHGKAVAIDPRTGHDTTMIYCQREMGRGLACKIFKWLKYVGFILVPLALIFLNQVISSHPQLLKVLGVK